MKIDPNKIERTTISKNMMIRKQTCEITMDAFIVEEKGKRIILDEDIIERTIQEVAQVMQKRQTKYNPIPKSITFSHEEKQQKEVNDQQKDYQLYEPQWNFDDVYLPGHAAEQVNSALAVAYHKETLLKTWGLESVLKNGRAVVMNFYGPPGTGKSMLADAIAKKLGTKILSVNYSQLESKYVGETPKNIQRVFQQAKEQDAVLIFDEADSFLGKRLTNVSQSADYGVNITRSVMLMELDQFDGVVIFTTNLLSNYDEAFYRRILASVEFSLPDVEGRRRIWETHLTNKIPLHQNVTAEHLASSFHNISGADIKDILLFASVQCLEAGRSDVTIKDFEKAYEFVRKRYENGSSFKIKTETITQEEYEKEISREKQGV